MDTNLEIAFHNMEPRADLEILIRERAEKLERLYDRMTGMRVAVEHQHRQHRTGNVFDVHIELMVPGNDIVVSRAPRKAKERYASPDAGTSIRDAFEVAERQLKAFKAKLRDDVKTHAPEEPGRVAQVSPAEDHGFILTPSGSMLYFHRNSCLNVALDELSAGEPVRFVETVGDTGPIATKVWRAAGTDTELRKG